MIKRRRLIGKQSLPPYVEEPIRRWPLLRLWRYLGPREWCASEATSRFQLEQEPQDGTSAWHNMYKDRFGTTFLEAMIRKALQCEMKDLQLGLRFWWKWNYFRELANRIVPGERAAGLELHSRISDLRTKSCSMADIERFRTNTINRFAYDPDPYLSPTQGYKFLRMKWPGGSVGRFDELFERVPRPMMDIFVAFEDFDRIEDVGETDFTGQQVTIWSDGKRLRGLGVHSPLLGALEISDRPELKGISVGITVQDLLKKLGSTTSDIEFAEGPGGPTLYFRDQLPGLLFEVASESRGQEEDGGGAWIGEESAWLASRLHYPLSAIYVW